MTARICAIALAFAASLTLVGCTSGGGGGVYYDPYPYRTGVYYHYNRYYRPGRPSRPPGTRPPRPVHLPARGGGRVRR